MKKFLGKIEFLNESNRPYTFGEFREKLQSVNEEEELQEVGKVELDDTADAAPIFSPADIDQLKHEIFGLLKGRNDTGLFYQARNIRYEPEEGVPSTVYMETSDINDYNLEPDVITNDPLTGDDRYDRTVKESKWDITLTFVDKRPVSEKEFEKELDYQSKLPEKIKVARSDKDTLSKSTARSKVEKAALAKPFVPAPPYLLWFDIDVVPTKQEKAEKAKAQAQPDTEEEESKLARKRAQEDARSEADLEQQAINFAKKFEKGEIKDITQD